MYHTNHKPKTQTPSTPHITHQITIISITFTHIFPKSLPSHYPFSPYPYQHLFSLNPYSLLPLYSYHSILSITTLSLLVSYPIILSIYLLYPNTSIYLYTTYINTIQYNIYTIQIFLLNFVRLIQIHPFLLCQTKISMAKLYKNILVVLTNRVRRRFPGFAI